MAKTKAGKAKTKKVEPKNSRPANPLTDRNQVRSAPGEWPAWQAHALSLGFGGASTWLRFLANRELGSDPRKT